MTHDDVRGMAAEYALGTLGPQESAAIDAHLAECAACRDAVADAARVLDALGRGVPQVDPPAALRARVLRAAVDATAPMPARAPAIAPAPSRAFAIAPWLVAAAAAIVAAAAGWQLVAGRAERARVVIEAEAELQRSQAVLTAADLVRFDLRGDGATARARAFWSRSEGLVFSAEGLAPLPSGRTYQLWIISRGTPISAGVFAATPSGTARIVGATPATVTAVDAVAVTIEPEGGLAAPSTAPILAGAAS